TLVLVDPSDDRGMKALLARLKDANPSVQYETADVLGELGVHGRAALPALLRTAKEDPSKELRAYATRAIGRIAPGSESEADAVAVLTGLVKDRTEEGLPAAGQAAFALWRFGPRAWTAAVVLREAWPELERQDAAGWAVE